jgi:hypothetical protein
MMSLASREKYRILQESDFRFLMVWGGASSLQEKPLDWGLSRLSYSFPWGERAVLWSFATMPEKTEGKVRQAKRAGGGLFSLDEFCDELEAIVYRDEPEKTHRLTVRTYTKDHLAADLCYVRGKFDKLGPRRRAIFDALSEAYILYWKWRTRGKLDDIVKRASEFLVRSPKDRKKMEDPFWVLIELTVRGDTTQDQKSKWKYRERLRFAASRTCKPGEFVELIELSGGINPPKRKKQTTPRGGAR